MSKLTKTQISLFIFIFLSLVVCSCFSGGSSVLGTKQGKKAKSGIHKGRVLWAKDNFGYWSNSQFPPLFKSSNCGSVLLRYLLPREGLTTTHFAIIEEDSIPKPIDKLKKEILAADFSDCTELHSQILGGPNLKIIKNDRDARIIKEDIVKMDNGKEMIKLITAYSYRSQSVENWESVYNKIEDETDKADYKKLVDYLSNIEYIFIHYLYADSNQSFKMSFKMYDGVFIFPRTQPYSEEYEARVDKVFRHFVIL